MNDSGPRLLTLRAFQNIQLDCTISHVSGQTIRHYPCRWNIDSNRAYIVIQVLRPDLFDVRQNPFRHRVCQERPTQSISKPDPHRERVQHCAELVLALGKCILHLLPLADIHRSTEELGNLSLGIANGMASYVRPNDRAILLEHTQLIVGTVHLSRDDSLPVLHGNRSIIWMHEIEPHKRICRELVVCVTE